MKDQFGPGQYILRDTGRPSDKNDVVDLVLLDLCVFQDLFDRFQGLFEEVHVQFFELCPSKGLRKVLPFVETLNFQSGGHLTGERTLTEVFESALRVQDR